MADTKLSALTAATPAGADLVYGVKGGNSRRFTAQGIANLAPGTDLSYDASTRLLSSSTGADVTLPLFTSSLAGLVGASGGGTTNFLRADGTWSAPPGGAGTDLSYDASTRLLSSSTGADVTLTLADGTNPGLLSAADFTKLGTNTGDVTLGTSVADVLDLSGQELRADDPGADRILFWDDSESKLRYLTLASGVVIDGTTLYADQVLGIACSDETTSLTTGTAKVTFRLPYAATLLAVKAEVNTAPTGSTLVVDINESGTSILSTKLSIDAGEKTSDTAATAAVISDSSLANDAEMAIDIDQIGSTIAGKGLKVWLYLRRTS